MRAFALAFVAGAALLQRQAELPELSWALLGIALLLAAALVPRRFLWFAVLGAGLALGSGWAAWRADVRLSTALPVALEGRDVEVEGVIAGLPQANDRGTRFPFHITGVRSSSDPNVRSVWLTWYEDAPKLMPGERWRFTVRLKRPRGASNPHGFDFEAWALERDIRATGYVRTKPSPALLDGRVEGWAYSLHRWRAEVRDAMRAHLGEARLAGVLVALAIGDQDAIAAADWDVFWRTGVGHLMSISGLHITMLAALAAAIVYFVWVRIPWLALWRPARKAALVAGLATAFAYCLATGYAVPAQRTVLMLAVMVACVLADRHASPSRVLCLAALIVVAVDPWAVLAAGFWLSFGAVAAIFYAAALRVGAPGFAQAAAREQVAVTLALLPLLIALFQQVSLVAPLANAFAVPLVSLAVVPLTLAGALLPFPVLLDVAHALMLFAMQALEAMGAWPLAMVESHAPAPWTVAIAIVGCAWLLAPRGVPLRSLGAVWIAPLFLVGGERPPEGAAWVDVLDVGNGLAVVVRTAAHTLVYDAGPTWNAEADAGNRVVVPFLRGEGVPRIDALIVSHADDDHAGGAASVERLRSPVWVLSPQNGRCEAGMRWRWDGVDFAVLHPGMQPVRRENDRSCVVRVVSGAGMSMLLTGDIEARSEAGLLARGETLASDVLLMPHHGSRTSSTVRFIEAAMPAVAIASAAHRSRFGHPHEVVLRRYVERGIEIRRTDREGALQVRLPAQPRDPIAIAGHAATQVRYWSERRAFP